MRFIAESCGCFWGRCLASRLESKNFPTNDEAYDLLLTCSRPITMSVIVQPSPKGDPEGGAQDAHRFSTRQEASSKNPGFAADGRFGLDLNVSLVTFLTRAYGSRPSGRLRRSRRTRRSAPKKVTRARRGSTAVVCRCEPKTFDSTHSDPRGHTHEHDVEKSSKRVIRSCRRCGCFSSARR